MPEAIVKAKPIEPLSQYIRRDEIKEKFALVLGNDREALRFIQDVILVVETAEPGEYSLKNCTPHSIVRCALKAATQRVTVNAEDRQAFMIPNRITRNRGKENETVTMEARFQFHYQEIYNRAMRSGRYAIINVSPVFEGSEVFEDIYTGLHVVQLPNGLMTQGENVSRLRRVSDRRGNRIGWLGYYRTMHGQERTVYLPIDEIERRANFNKAHSYSFGWKDHRETMEMKTVLLALLRLADLTADGMRDVKAALENVDAAENQPDDELEEIPDGKITELDENQENVEQRVEDESAYVAAGEIKTKKGKTLKECDDDMLAYIIANSKDDELVRYARTRLEWHNAHPNPVKSEKQLMTELGY